MQVAFIGNQTNQREDRLTILARKAACYASESQSLNTLRAYRSDWADFEFWCVLGDLVALPALSSTVGLYLTERAETCKTSTIKRRIASIAHMHLAHGFDSPRENSTVKAVLSGIRRRNGGKQVGRSPLLKDDLQAMIRVLPENLMGVRDKAILLLGFFSACRRSELVGLDVDHLDFSRQGLIIQIRKSKTDQESEGREVGVPYAKDSFFCPVRALKQWLETSEINSKAVYRRIHRSGRVGNMRLTGRSVAMIVKRSAEAAGIDSEKISSHSLRSGFCTEAALRGVEERIIMRQTGHKSVGVVRGYIKEASVFQNNGAEAVSF